MAPRRRRPPRSGAMADLPPLKIALQILILQSAWYGTATLLILFTALVAGQPINFDLILSWKSLRGDTTIGWTLGLLWLLNSLFGVCFILLLVARSKMVLDFALTLHFVHLVIVSLYTQSLPRNWLWWALQCASAALMTFLGIWACQWRELRPITFGGSGGQNTQNNTRGQDQLSGSPQASIGDEENGFIAAFGRGRRGRGKDGAGEYEMVGLNGEPPAQSKAS